MAFHALKQQLTSAPLLLRFPVDGFPLQLATDASGVATGGVLYQDVNGKRHNLFYHSKVLLPVEQKYSVPEKETLAIFHCLQRMRTLVLGRTIYIHTDHCPICGMLDKPVNNRRIERIANLIQEYQIAEIKHIDGKNNCLPDYLSRPDDDPLFDIPYGVESKLSFITAPSSPSPSPLPLNFLSPMNLRPRHKSPQYVFNDLEKEDTASYRSDTSVTTRLPQITTTSSPNLFDLSGLQTKQEQDPAISSLITQLLNNSNPRFPLSSSFLIKDNILHKLITLTPHSLRKIAVPYLPSSMVKSFLTAMHDDPYQGDHFSTDKMFSK